MNEREVYALWPIVTGAETFEKFKLNLLPQFEYNENVPKEIVGQLDVVRSLLEDSYYNYAYLEVALEKIFKVLELALHLKYKSLHPQKTKDREIKWYMDWAVREKIIKISKSQKDWVLEIRNKVTHPKRDTAYGMACLKTVDIIINEIVYDLYD